MTDTEKELVIAQQYSDVADSYLRYLNEKNLEGILSLYADNATVEDPVGSDVVAGKAELRNFYTKAVNTDIVLTRTGQVRVAGVEIAFPFQLRMNVDGVPMVTDIIDVFRFDAAGKIVSMRAFWGPFNYKQAKE
ncbi:MAG: nuclear transport factor 2 family protein [Gelidibacter sp.]